MIIVGDIVERVREYLRQELFTGEVADTRVEARQAKAIRAQTFSTEDLILRIARAQLEIISRCDSCLFPGAINVVQLPTFTADNITARVPQDIIRVLENRIFRGNERCLVLDSDNTNPRESNMCKMATADSPVAAIGGGIIRFYPDGNGNQVGVVQSPAPPALVTDQLILPTLFEEAVVQHVLETCRVTQAHDGTDSELYKQLARYSRKLFEEEIVPHLLESRMSTSFVDAEASVENRSR